MPSLLQVLTDNDRRGAQVFGVELGAALALRGWDVTTVALAPGAVGGLDVPILGARALAPSTLAALRGRMRDADVVVAHGSTTLPACAAAGAGIDTPLLYRSIGDPRFWARSGARRVRLRAYYHRVTRVVALWPGAADAIAHDLGVGRERIAVIPNGVPARAWPATDTARRHSARAALGLPPQAPVVAYVGALSPEKRVGAAIHALAGLPSAQQRPPRPPTEARRPALAEMAAGAARSGAPPPGGDGQATWALPSDPGGQDVAHLAAHGPLDAVAGDPRPRSLDGGPPHLVVAGDGPQRAVLGAVAARVLPGRVRFLGSVADPSDVMAAADLIVLPSASEGMPGVLIEAGLVGVGAVATDVGGVAEVVVDGVTGLLVPPGDDVALRDTLATALPHAATLGAAARERCLAHFDLEVVTDSWDAELRGVLA